MPDADRALSTRFPASRCVRSDAPGVRRPARGVRRSVLTLGLAQAAACLVPGPVADANEADALLELKGTPAVVRTPGPGPGVGKQLAPGQWQITWTRKGTRFQFQARVFPVRSNREPGSVLPQAIDTLVRGSTLGGFGLSSRKSFEVWGRPAAEAAIQIALDGKVARGFARLLLVTEHQWALAWGIVAPPEISRANLGAIRRFVRSLEPRDPTFYRPRFAPAAELQKVVYKAPEESPVRQGHLRAICGLLESALGRRFPVSIRTNVESMLLLDVQQGTPATRKGYLASAADVSRSMELPAPARAERMEALGKRIQQAVTTRAKTGYRPAIGLQRVWMNDGEAKVGSGPAGWSFGTVQSELELAAFLVSIVTDAPFDVPEGALAEHAKALAPVWKPLTDEERAPRADIRGDWARLRHAFDVARPGKRTAFRFAVARALAPERDVPKDGALRDLKHWMAVQRAPETVRSLWTRALAMSPAARRALIEVLGVDAKGFQLGW